MGHSSPFWVQGICPAYPTRCSIGYLTCGRRLFGAKTVLMIFTCLTLIHVFAQVLIIVFVVTFSLLILIFSLLKPFFLQLHLLLIFRNISLNSPEMFILFSVTFHLIFNGFSFIFSCHLSYLFELSNLYWFVYLFVYLLVSSLELFYSCLVIFISCYC